MSKTELYGTETKRRDYARSGSGVFVQDKQDQLLLTTYWQYGHVSGYLRSCVCEGIVCFPVPLGSHQDPSSFHLPAPFICFLCPEHTRGPSTSQV